MEFSGGLSSWPMKYHFWHQDIFGKNNRLLLLSDSGSKQILVFNWISHWRLDLVYLVIDESRESPSPRLEKQKSKPKREAKSTKKPKTNQKV
jgi:hypothetical protein